MRPKKSAFKLAQRGERHLLHGNSEVSNFYGISESGFSNSRPPPYLLRFDKCNDIIAYTNEVDSECLKQIKNLAMLDIIKGHVTILPDVHLGKGIIIGSVFLTKDFIIPNGVGVDIGCGVLCVKINKLKKKNLREHIINNIYKKIKRNVPLSFDSHEKEVFDAKKVLDGLVAKYASRNMAHIMTPRHLKQMGTLGGGNHFIEIAYDASDGGEEALSGNQSGETHQNDAPHSYTSEQNHSPESDIYILIHSGSRNIGKRTAEFYDELASQESKVKRNDLAYLDLKKEQGQNYLKDMQLCLEYAKCNRIYMMKIIERIIYEEVNCTLDWQSVINIHHNFCNQELVTYVHSGEVKREYMYVTRKGATSSKKNQLGVIPGNMKVGSYIVRGKGNKLSYSSCSHGCGRVLSRTHAKKIINQTDFVNIMRGVRCDTNARIRDEAPQAYKNLGQVLRNQDSLVHVVRRLLPLINVKGE
ncbi:tRNA-splicing ligase RtcB, putative [Plasmodium vivax]|uniref:3'-phosphate/5'-hydroxy nucleic acid ligase n=7 Tax=Plasmodium vivax TaxID=5855 RepID=A5K021_PLAVS|nr:hypothetical protein, conserved [Plasmodium vivax]KMZ78135.1 hypothetical protein PVIIG_00822 [Plasmodium vivax India VII]KMZ84473.1 hypothetical protein PVBG_00253 [Plasmodium vivax Brazil I]KMZ90253.1 hypothetical protein PVMG_01620 [Plasmodium vivax Mauritania I]KMZ96964.1 hypothetical protein PVNG_01788 [Plasmodium vivax North Korean]EDL47582.1 hypothetical protein, conserved [Plasmodium vivax]|eukprot:XP_001617309.1 hypothetical protein [Plasmodium vivax Sal-1]